MKYILLVIVFTTTFLCFAQNKGTSDKIEAMKIAFLTNKMELTSKEAQLFWPLYNEYNDKAEKLRKVKRSDFSELKNKMDNLTDAQIRQYMNEVLDTKQKELTLEKEYFEKYIKVLPAKKLAKLYQAENLFKKELIRKLKEH
jgi:hypothetical protein